MTQRDPWPKHSQRRHAESGRLRAESQRRFEDGQRGIREGFRRLDRHFRWYLFGIVVVWLGVGAAIKWL